MKPKTPKIIADFLDWAVQRIAQNPVEVLCRIYQPLDAVIALDPVEVAVIPAVVLPVTLMLARSLVCTHLSPVEVIM